MCQLDPPCRNLLLLRTYGRKGESGKITLHNWHPDQGQPWQLNNTTFNLSELIMSYCYNARGY